MAQLMDLMKNQRKRKNIFGQEITETRPMSETANAAGLRAQPTDAVTTGQLGGTPKQQEMAGAKQTQDAALQQAQKPALGDRLATQQRQQQAFELPQSGDTVEAARGLIESAAQARQQRLEELINLPAEVKAIPEVASLIAEFEATEDPSKKAEIAGRLQGIVDRNTQTQTYSAIDEAYQGAMTSEDLAVNYFEDPEEYNNIVSTLTEAGIDFPDPQNVSFEQLETKIQEYSDSVTGQIDQAMDMLDDPSAPAQLKETARQALRDLGASQLIATDYELENLAEELESRDEYTITVDGTEVTGNLGALLENPVVSGAATAFLSELLAVPGVDPQQREANRRELLNRKGDENPELKFLYQSIFDNANSYEAALEEEMVNAQPVVDILDKNAKTRQAVIDTVGHGMSDLFDLGLQLDEYNDSMIQMVLDPANEETVGLLKDLHEAGAVDRAFMDRIEALPQAVRGERLKNYANAYPAFQSAKALLASGASSMGNKMLNQAFDAIKLPKSINGILNDVRNNPSRYSDKDRAIVGRFDPDNTGSINLETIGDTALEMLLEGIDLGALPRRPVRDQLREDLGKQANAITSSPDYRKLQFSSGNSATQGKALQVKADLQNYRNQLAELYQSSPPDVRDSMLFAIQAVDNDIARANKQYENVVLKDKLMAARSKARYDRFEAEKAARAAKAAARKKFAEDLAEKKRQRAKREKSLYQKAQRKFKTSEKGGRLPTLTKEQLYREVYRITRPEEYKRSKYNKPKVRTGRMGRS